MMTLQQAFDLALQHHQAGRLGEAEALYRQILAVQPAHAGALHFLGVAALQAGQHETGAELIRQAVVLEPDNAAVHSHLGEAYRASGRLDEALASFRRALALAPDYPITYYNMALALDDGGRFEEAMAAYRRGIHLKPGYIAAHVNLANLLREQGQMDEAAAELRQALLLSPAHWEAHNNLGNTLKDQGLFAESIAAYRRAIQFRPNDAGVHSNLVYALHFLPIPDEAGFLEERALWNRRFSDPLKPLILPHANERSSGRRLRIGYVSPDFRHHVICHFLTPLLEAHDHTQFSIHCYSSVKRPDAITERLKKTADVWSDVGGIRDEALAETIRADGIDILVDLTLHMADNRLLLFARKPAPVQVTWLGYPGSTGLPAMDYRFTDTFLEPADSAWSNSVDKPVRLPDSWCCFDPIDAYPEPGPLPALTAGHVTFGSLNNFCKINEAVLRLWAQVLQSVDGSRLLMQCPAGSTQARVRQWFEAHGIAAHRLELVSRTARREEFLQLFERIDLALETFPYNGGTTTCEALWMGVPVPTFPGSTAVSRQGLSILSAAGLHELIAAGQDEYVRLTVSLATDLPRLADLRSMLRQRMKTSAFMDAQRFARGVEAAYRTMWRRWCAEKVDPR